MVTLVTGFPGSGKSYYAIDKIYNILSSAKKATFDIIYTNINGVKFDFFPNSELEFIKLDEDKLYEYLSVLYTQYEIFKSSDNLDDELIKISKEFKYHNALFVFDECHSFFDNQDKYKIFWLTYHRHLFHEIILLTQNKTLIHSKYRAIPEIFIEAQPRSKKLFNNTLNYKKYSSFAMRKSDLFGKENLTTRNEVFNLYQSGNKSNQKSIVTKYIKLIIVFIVIVFGAFYYILNSFKSEVDPIAPDTLSSNTNNISHKPILPEKINDNNSNIDNKNDDSFVISLFCDNKIGCILKNNTYPIFYINKFILSTDSERLHSENLYFNKRLNHRIYKIYINTSKKDLKEYFILNDNILDNNIKKIKRNNKELSEPTDIYKGVKL